MISCLIGKPNDRKPVSLPRGKSEIEDVLIRFFVIEGWSIDLHLDNFKI
jgi:hypothetical protein